MKILIATHNPAKFERYRRLLAEYEAASTNFLPENMQPGVYVRRLNGGKEATDEEEKLEVDRVGFEDFFIKFPDWINM
jgi:inosine/xanthosine triphosphate pyrophosphatase family protein